MQKKSHDINTKTNVPSGVNECEKKAYHHNKRIYTYADPSVRYYVNDEYKKPCYQHEVGLYAPRTWWQSSCMSCGRLVCASYTVAKGVV